MNNNIKMTLEIAGINYAAIALDVVGVVTSNLTTPPTSSQEIMPIGTTLWGKDGFGSGFLQGQAVHKRC